MVDIKIKQIGKEDKKWVSLVIRRRWGSIRDEIELEINLKVNNFVRNFIFGG